MEPEHQPAVQIRPVSPDEGERLREITIAAKAHWGYEPARVVEWASQGDFSPDGLSRLEIWVAEDGGELAGWASLIDKGDVGWLEDLWIEPRWMGRGIGSALFGQVAAEARRRGAAWMEWEAEPNALGFYEKMGGRCVRESAPTEWGRTLPIMGIDLSSTPPASPR
jgi:GNAT superfamily N-acetyltransferase